MRKTIYTLLLLAAGGLALSGCSAAREAMGLGKFPPDEFQVVTHTPLALPPNYDLVKPDPGAPRPQEESASQLAEAAVIGNVGAAQIANASGTDVTNASATQEASSAPAAEAPAPSAQAPAPSAEAPASGTEAPAPTAELTAPAAGPTEAGPSVAAPSAPAAEAPAQVAEATASPGEQAFLQTAGTAKADPKIRLLVNQDAKAETDSINNSLYYKIIWWQTPDPPGTVVNPAGEQQRLQENAALGLPLTQGATPVILRRKKAALEGIF